MKPEEFKAITSKIVQNRDNQALVTELITKVNDSFTELATNHDSMQGQVGDYEKQVEELQKTNMNLFLKVGSPVQNDKVNDPEPLKYEDLDLLKNMEGNK